MNEPLAPHVRLIGRYTILRETRRDRASVSYVAMDPVMQREVTLKAVHLPPPADGKAGSEAEISRLEAAFVRQAQAAGKLHHPNIVTVFDAGRVHNVGYMAIERVSGKPLHDLLASGWRLQPVHCASLAARVADAIEYAHQQGVTHGQLGPQHIYVRDDGVPKVAGFGGWMDAGYAGDEALERTDRWLPFFENEVSEEARRRDVQGVAGILHMLLTGKSPRRESATSAVFVPVEQMRADLPAPLVALVNDTLNPNHAASRRTAADLRDALTAFIWNARKTGVAPATLGIPLSAPPADLPAAEKAAASFPPTPLQTFKPALTVPPPTQRPSEVAAVPSKTPSNAARNVMQRDKDDDAQYDTQFNDAGANSGALSDRLIDSARRAADRAAPWVGANRHALIAVAGLIAAGVVIGVILANVVGRNNSVLPVKPAAVESAPMKPLPTGIVQLDVAPWGEVVVDGKPYGVTPPLTELTLPIGKHLIEIRHADKPAVAAQVEVDAAKPLRITHRFE